MTNFQLFFTVQGTGGRPTGSDSENRVGNQDTGKLGRLDSSELQGLVSLGEVAATFSFKMSFNCTSRDE